MKIHCYLCNRNISYAVRDRLAKVDYINGLKELEILRLIHYICNIQLANMCDNCANKCITKISNNLEDILLAKRKECCKSTKCWIHNNDQ